MKIFLAICAIIFFVFGFTGCNSCTQQLKNLESDFSALDRNLVVTNAFTGDTVWKYSGDCYISEGSKAGDVTVIYYVGKKAKKADFVGNFILSAIEK